MPEVVRTVTLAVCSARKINVCVRYVMGEYKVIEHSPKHNNKSISASNVAVSIIGI
jgi:hypothetical protein